MTNQITKIELDGKILGYKLLLSNDSLSIYEIKYKIK